MILVSMLLVVAAATVLIIGVFFAGRDLTLVYTSIGLCLVAAALLGVGVTRHRPARRRAVEPETNGGASWSGAAAKDVGGNTDPAHEAAAGRLADVPDLTAEQRAELLAYYGDLHGLRQATTDELATVASLSPDTARRVYDTVRDA